MSIREPGDCGSDGPRRRVFRVRQRRTSAVAWREDRYAGRLQQRYEDNSTKFESASAEAGDSCNCQPQV